MTTTLAITDAQIQANIVRAVGDVFRTMLARPAVLISPDAQTEPAALAAALAVPQVVGSVGFVGKANGIIYLCFDVAGARLFMGNMIGLDAAETAALDDDSVNDAIGELTNMVAGSFKNALCDLGYPCKLNIPSILRGSNFCVSPWPAHSARRYAYTFASGDHPIVAEILMKADE